MPIAASTLPIVPAPPSPAPSTVSIGISSTSPMPSVSADASIRTPSTAAGRGSKRSLTGAGLSIASPDLAAMGNLQALKVAVAHPITLSPELALLAACDLAPDEVLAQRAAGAARSGAGSGPGSAIDWGRFAILARRHGMAAMAGDRLARAAPGAMPAPLARSLHRSLLDDTALQLAHSAEAAKLTARLAAGGIGAIVLKGAAVAHMLYPDNPQWRNSSDIDLLVDPGHFLAADRLLRGAGYARHWPAGGLPGAGLDMLLHLANVFEYRDPQTNRLIELHCRTQLNPHAPQASFAELFAATAAIETGCGAIRGLDGPHLVAYLSRHAVGHVGVRLKWFGDLDRALRRVSAAGCAAYAAPGGLRSALYPAEVADSVLAVLASAARGQVPASAAVPRPREARRIVRDMESLTDRPPARSLATLPLELAELRVDLSMAPGAAAKAWQLLHTLSDPRDVYLLRRGRNWAWLYAALGPLLSARRYVHRLAPGSGRGSV